MFGKNPIRPPTKGDGNILEVEHIFLTLQGEGPYAGTPSVFIRLGGCNLACTFCDTEFESFKEMTLDDIFSQTNLLINNKPIKLIVITGGEPLRQPIAPLCEKLIELGFKVQIETNGTLYRELPAEVDIICSPKNTGLGYAPIREDILSRAKAIKYIISAYDKKYSSAPALPANVEVFLQPMDEYDEAKNQANIQLALKIALKTGYRLSLQTHKYLGIE